MTSFSTTYTAYTEPEYQGVTNQVPYTGGGTDTYTKHHNIRDENYSLSKFAQWPTNENYSLSKFAQWPTNENYSLSKFCQWPTNENYSMSNGPIL